MSFQSALYKHVIFEFYLNYSSDYTFISKITCTTSVFQMFVVFTDLHDYYYYLCVLCYMLGLYFCMTDKNDFVYKLSL